MRNKRCIVCNDLFTPLKSFARFCSGKCRARDRRVRNGLKPELKKDCETCGTPFTTIQGHQRFCSGSCRTKAEWKRQCRKRQVEPLQLERDCEHCGKVFQVAMKTQRYCSRLCKNRGGKVRRKEQGVKYQAQMEKWSRVKDSPVYEELIENKAFASHEIMEPRTHHRNTLAQGMMWDR